jgi:HEAT repeat protein
VAAAEEAGLVLERVGDVPWGELNAACGPAEWVPEALEGLLDPAPEARTEAFEWLEAGIFHQEGVDESTPHVVPFLIELAAFPETPDRARLLLFLARLIDADRGEHFDPTTDPAAADREAESIEREYEVLRAEHWEATGESPWRACQAAVWRGAESLMALLQDADPRVCTAVGIVLGVLVRDGGGALPNDAARRIAGRLREAIAAETDPVVRFGHVLTLGTVASRCVEAREWLHAIERAAALDEPAGLAAAIRLVDLDEPIGEVLGIRIVERMLRFDPVPYRGQPWWNRPFSGERDEVLIEVEDGIERRFARLVERYPRLGDVARRRAAPGLPAERANALRLLGGPRGTLVEKTDAPPIPVEPEADLIVRLAAAEVEVGRLTAEPYEFAWPTALEALRHPDPGVRLRAALVLYSVDASEVAPRAEEVAAIAWRERDPSVLDALDWAFANHTHCVRALLRTLIRTPRNAPGGPEDRSLHPSLWSRLGSQPKVVTAEEAARWLIARIDGPASIQALDSDRARAVEILRGLRLPPRTLRPLLGRLLSTDPDPKVRRAAVESSMVVPARIDKLPPLKALLGALKDDPSAVVRRAAAQALAPFLMATGWNPARARATVRALAAALDADPHWRVREAAASNLLLAAPTRQEAEGPMWRQIGRHAGLGQSAPGSRRAVDALVRAASGDPRYAVREQAGRSLQNVAAAVPGLLARLGSAPPHGRAGAADALVWVGKPAEAAVPELFAAVSDEPDATVRRRIAHALRRLIPGDDVGRWLSPLARVLSDPDPEVRGHITARLEWARTAAGRLAPGLADNLKLDSDRLRRRTLKTIASIGPAAEVALPAVLELIHSAPAGFRLLALKAAWAINGDRPLHVGEVLQAINPLLTGPSPAARDQAAELLRTIIEALAPDRPERDRALALLRDVPTSRPD